MEEPRPTRGIMEEEEARHGGDGDDGGGGEFTSLPEDCIIHALSLTTPRDACRAAGTSSIFRSAAASDMAWECFLPPDCAAILSRAVVPVEFSSKRDLFFRLCHPILIDGGRRSFAIDQETGKKCFMISAREMTIVWGDSSYWYWISMPGSRFPECAVLNDVWLLELHGRIDTRELSAETNYAVYLVFKLRGSVKCWGEKFPPIIASVKLESSGEVASTHTVRLVRVAAWKKTAELDRPDATPSARDDGWMEVLVGEFFNRCGDDGELDASLLQTLASIKEGLVVHGMEFRPKKLVSSQWNSTDW